jgi:hypothetical protein
MPEDRDFARGQRLLRELLPWARAEASKDDSKAEIESALGKAAVTYLTEENLDALIIYPAPKGGWHADIVLKTVPPGIPNVFGTPVAHPCRTRAEAEDTGKRLLVSLLILAGRNAGAKPAPPVFMLDGWTFKLLPELYDVALAAFPDRVNGYGTKLQAAGRVEAALDQLCPEGFDGDTYNTWPREKQAQLLTVIHIAVLSGLYAWPMRQDAAPDEGEPSNG